MDWNCSVMDKNNYRNRNGIRSEVTITQSLHTTCRSLPADDAQQNIKHVILALAATNQLLHQDALRAKLAKATVDTQ